MRKTMLPLVAAFAALLLVAGCGSDGDTTAGDTTAGDATAGDTTAAHNAADVTFAQSMIPHHRQAVEMAELADTRAESAQVKELAAQIKAAQDPEIKTMTGWLEAWGEDVPEDTKDTGDTGDMAGHGDTHMPGMMSAEDLDELGTARGATFDTRFMEMMIEHHEGAIEMARTEQGDGEYAEAKQLAKAIEEAQTTEIATMRKLLGKG